ncbi:ATP-binding protein [Streptomyces sp. NPDC054770]
MTVTADGPSPVTVPDDAGQRHLTARLRLVERRIRHAVEQRRGGDPAPDDPFRGLYLSETDLDRILSDATGGPPEAGDTALLEAEAEADRAEEARARLPLRDLARNFALTPLDVELLLIAVLPETDRRFEQLYGYLNDDVTRRRAGIGLALELTGSGPPHSAARSRLAPCSPLVTGGLLLVEDTDRPFLSRALRVPDRVVAHLLGEDTPDPALGGVLRPPPAVPAAGSAAAGALGHAVRAGARLAYLREEPGGGATTLAAAALAAASRPALHLDLAVLAAEPVPEPLLTELAREARLRGAAVVAGPVDALTPDHSRLLRRLTALPVPVLLTGRTGWDPRWAEDSPLLVTAGPLTPAQRESLWRQALDGARLDHGVDVGRLCAPLSLTPQQIARAGAAARRQSLLTDGPVTAAHLRAGVRAQNASGLERLARRIEPAVGWDDLVLPAATAANLGELALRARHRDQVLGAWRMRPGGGRGRGVLALFAGDSGTGKTMAAEVIAADLGLDLYVVDLSTVVDKYVGETEKNLERIFTEAAEVNGILLFDEADAVFGKRSEVKDAHDRYANLESAYLLQRLESFDGIAVLTTNLRANLDEAFTRRLDVVIDFPLPDAAQRRALWDVCLGRELPRGDGLDLDRCSRFELAGGSIRACAVTAAYLAAEAGRPLAMADLVAAVQSEYRKLGRLLLPHEFPPHEFPPHGFQPHGFQPHERTPASGTNGTGPAGPPGGTTPFP